MSEERDPIKDWEERHPNQKQDWKAYKEEQMARQKRWKLLADITSFTPEKRGDVTYDLKESPEGEIGCSCEDWRFDGRRRRAKKSGLPVPPRGCKHTDAILAQNKKLELLVAKSGEAEVHIKHNGQEWVLKYKEGT